MPKRTLAEAAKIILESDFGNDSEIEDLSDEEGRNEEAMPVLNKVHNDLVGNAPAVDETSNVPALALNKIPDEEPPAKKIKKEQKFPGKRKSLFLQHLQKKFVMHLQMNLFWLIHIVKIFYPVL